VATACGSCTAPVTDAYLCAGCTRDLAEQLLLAASIAADLDDAIAKLLKRGTGGPRSEAEAPLPIDLAASEVADRLHRSLVYWVAELWRPPMPWPGSRTDVLATWLNVRRGLIRRHQHAPRMLNEVRTNVRDALAVIDRQPERAPAGQCSECGKQLLAELDTDTATCSCGAVATGLLQARAERAAKADQIETATVISRTLERMGITVAAGTIRMWATRSRLAQLGELYGQPAYSLTAVIGLCAQRDEKRVRA
jgi:hypothetical protein